jgi:ABC-type uncharacterized transport system ATPase subunit
MAEMMVGKSLSQPARAETEAGEVLLTVSGLTLEPASPFGTPLRHIGFEVRAGEVLGIGGVAGNGQDELLAALSGERPVEPGMIEFKGAAIGDTGPEARRKLGLLCAPEERLGHAAAPDMSLTENAVLTGRTRRGLDRSGFVGWGRARAFAEEIIERFDVRTPGPGVAARALSGGNLQKYVIGREILQAPEVLVVNQPTWGVDASPPPRSGRRFWTSRRTARRLSSSARISTSLLEVSDRFCALNEGRLSRRAPRAACRWRRSA